MDLWGFLFHNNHTDFYLVILTILKKSLRGGCYAIFQQMDLELLIHLYHCVNRLFPFFSAHLFFKQLSQVSGNLWQILNVFSPMFFSFPMCKLRQPSFLDIVTLWLQNDKYLKTLQSHFTNPCSVTVSLYETFYVFLKTKYAFSVLLTGIEGEREMATGLFKRSNAFLSIISACKILGKCSESFIDKKFKVGE